MILSEEEQYRILHFLFDVLYKRSCVYTSYMAVSQRTCQSDSRISGRNKRKMSYVILVSSIIDEALCTNTTVFSPVFAMKFDTENLRFDIFLVMVGLNEIWMDHDFVFFWSPFYFGAAPIWGTSSIALWDYFIIQSMVVQYRR